MQTLKKNYRAWEIDIQSFYAESSSESKLLFLARFGLLAPSSHNCQPWEVEVQNNALYIFEAEARSLSVSDSHKKHLYVAIGAFVENCCIAGDYYKQKVDVTFFPNEMKGAIAKLSFVVPPAVSASQSGGDHLAFQIMKRQSNRNPYQSEAPTRELLTQLLGYEIPGLTITLFDTPEKRSKLAEILILFREKVFDSVPFRIELSRYKRTNFTRDYLGMPGFTMGFPDLLSLIVPTVIRYVNVMKIIKQKDIELIAKHTCVAGIISVREATPLSWLSVGRVLERLLLESGQNGMATALGAVPQDMPELNALLPAGCSPVIFFRMGRTSEAAGHSPRLPLEMITR